MSFPKNNDTKKTIKNRTLLRADLISYTGLHGNVGFWSWSYEYCNIRFSRSSLCYWFLGFYAGLWFWFWYWFWFGFRFGFWFRFRLRFEHWFQFWFRLRKWFGYIPDHWKGSTGRSQIVGSPSNSDPRCRIRHKDALKLFAFFQDSPVEYDVIGKSLHCVRVQVYVNAFHRRSWKYSHRYKNDLKNGY